MVYRLTCAVSTNDELLLQQFKARLSPAGIRASDLASPNSRYSYLELQWDDAGIPAAPENHGCHRAGAKPKKLLLDGRPATCGQVWQLREKDHLSDAAVGSVLDASESTITRRRKKHLADGDFYSGSTVVF